MLCVYKRGTALSGASCRGWICSARLEVPPNAEEPLLMWLRADDMAVFAEADERPVALVILDAGKEVSEQTILTHCETAFAKWQDGVPAPPVAWTLP